MLNSHLAVTSASSLVCVPSPATESPCLLFRPPSLVHVTLRDRSTMAGPTQLLLQEFRHLLDHTNRNHHNAYNNSIQNFLNEYETVKNRALAVGGVPIDHNCAEFSYRYELTFVGLHNHLLCEICIGRDEADSRVCTCAVAKYARHNYEEEQYFVYGGEGGRLTLANNSNRVRVLEDKRWTKGNSTCFSLCLYLILHVS